MRRFLVAATISTRRLRWQEHHSSHCRIKTAASSAQQGMNASATNAHRHRPAVHRQRRG